MQTDGARSLWGEWAPLLRGDHVLGKPSTVGGNVWVTGAREVTCRLWSGGRMGSPLSIMGAGRTAERWSSGRAHVGTGLVWQLYSKG